MHEVQPRAPDPPGCRQSWYASAAVSRRQHRRALCNGVALWSLSFVIGCSADCLEPGDAIKYTGGTTDAAGTTYMSSGWEGPFLHFPGGRQFNLIHELTAEPTSVDIYLAFQERIPSYEKLSPASGNSATFNVKDGFVWVRNDTCSEFYLLVVAKADGGNASDAGDSGGD
jgi:hypothetical protein